MLAPSMMGSRIGRDSTLACGTAPCPSRRSSALPFVTTPDNRLRYKRDNSRLCTEGRCRHLVHPRRLRKAVAQGSARLTDDSDAPDRMCDGLKFEGEQGATPVIQPPSPVPGGLEPDPSCVRAGFRNRLYEGNDHTAEASTPRQCRALAGRRVPRPPHFAAGTVPNENMSLRASTSLPSTC